MRLNSQFVSPPNYRIHPRAHILRTRNTRMRTPAPALLHPTQHQILRCGSSRVPRYTPVLLCPLPLPGGTYDPWRPRKVWRHRGTPGLLSMLLSKRTGIAFAPTRLLGAAHHLVESSTLPVGCAPGVRQGSCSWKRSVREQQRSLPPVRRVPRFRPPPTGTSLCCSTGTPNCHSFTTSHDEKYVQGHHHRGLPILAMTTEPSANQEVPPRKRCSASSWGLPAVEVLSRVPIIEQGDQSGNTMAEELAPVS